MNPALSLQTTKDAERSGALAPEAVWKCGAAGSGAPRKGDLGLPGAAEETDLMEEDVVEMTFFVPVRFDKDLEAGYKLCLQFGGTYYDDDEERMNSVTVFPGCDMRKTITSKLSLENGKIYGFRVTI